MRVVGGRRDLGWSMAINPESKSHSRRSAGILLLIGVLVGVTVGGGVGVIAASSTKSVTVCANKKTNVLRYAKNGKCAKTETKVLLNQTGADGMSGAAGTAGAKGDTGAAGTAGAKGDTGAAGTAGADGTPGADGINGTNGTNGAAGASSPTGFTARSVCGSNGTTLCAVGVPGPGGGTIVYVDSTNEMPGYDYLEVAPYDSPFQPDWSTSTEKCGIAASTSCETSFLSDAGTALGYIGLGTGRAATAAIVARHEAGGVVKADYAAGAADVYITATASDWFLPSKDELNEVCKYARNTNQETGAATVCFGGTLRIDFNPISYWSSSEDYSNLAWVHYFNDGLQFAGPKGEIARVRPVRAF